MLVLQTQEVAGFRGAGGTKVAVHGWRNYRDRPILGNSTSCGCRCSVQRRALDCFADTATPDTAGTVAVVFPFASKRRGDGARRGPSDNAELAAAAGEPPL